MSSFAAAAAAPDVDLLDVEETRPGCAPLHDEVPHLFVIPADNEEANLPRLLKDLEARPGLFPPGSRLYVVDDG